VIGGAMAFTFIKAQGGNVGKSLVEDDKIELALSLLSEAKSLGVRILLPVDALAADSFDNDSPFELCDSANINNERMGLDIGQQSQDLFAAAIEDAKTIFWNGPMGVFEFENFAQGTAAIAEAVVRATQNGAFSLVGGGDSVAALQQMGKADEVSFISTGGGAMLELIENGSLVGVAAIGN
jgi:phosphoglycerate kinase